MFKRIKDIFTRNEEKTDNSSKYIDLAPIDSIDDDSEYLSALEWALGNEKIHNIAISGTYGSGKSSIINTYIKKHKNLKYLKISMANFSDSEIESDELEKIIVKQLLYQVKSQRIPQSRYKKIKLINSWKKIAAMIGCIFLTWFLTVFFVDDFYDLFNKRIEKISGNNFIISVLIYVTIILILVFIIALIVNIAFSIFARVRVKEVSFAGKAKAEINDTGETSFHKDLDEIVYFFEKTDKRVVFIEDFDRFDDKVIFVKLRELNTILNRYEGIKNRLIFVYAIKDGTFDNVDRIKFFDYILPVVSVVSSYNSSEVFLEMIKDDEEYNLSDDFIKAVSIYIDERRLLNNIYNEFITYKRVVSKNNNDKNERIKINDECLMALIIYKNICPNGFTALQNGEGIVTDLFERKKQFIESNKESLVVRKKDIEEELKNLNAEHLSNLKELKIILLDEISQDNGYVVIINTGGHPYNRNTIMGEDFDVSRISGKSTIHYYGQRGERTFNLDTNVIVKKYEGRLKALVLRDNNRIEKLNEVLEDTENEIRKIDSYSMKELLRNKYTREEVEKIDTSKNGLLLFLLENGWINEDYSYYINIFYEYSMKAEDRNYILSVRNNEKLEYDYNIPTPREVIKSMSLYEFERNAGYNFNILDELINNKEFVQKKDTFLKHLIKEYNDSFGFIDKYIKTSKNAKSFLVELTSVWDGFGEFIFTESTIKEQDKEYYFNLMCSELSVETLVKMNRNGTIKQYMEEKENVLFLMNEIDIERQKDIIDNLKIKFNRIITDGINSEVVEWIIENGFFSLTVEMIDLIFEVKKSARIEDIHTKNYTEICLLDYAPLSKKIDDNIEEYVSNVVIGLETNNDESIESIIDLIGKNISTETSVDLIKKQNAKLEFLSECSCEGRSEDEKKLIWDTWMSENKLSYCWENIIKYCEEFDFTDELLDYIENAVFELEEFDNEEVDISGIDAEVLKSSISKEALEKWITLTDRVELIVDEKEINRDNMKILLEKDYFDFSVDFASNLLENHPDLYVLGLERNEEEVMKQPTGYRVNSNHIDYLINSGRWKPESIISIIEANKNINFSETILKFIRENELKISHYTFEKTWNGLLKEDRYELLLNQIGIIDLDHLPELFIVLDNNYKKMADRSSSHKVLLDNTEYNQRLTDKLKERGYITSKNEENGRISIRIKKNS